VRGLRTTDSRGLFAQVADRTTSKDQESLLAFRPRAGHVRGMPLTAEDLGPCPPYISLLQIMALFVVTQASFRSICPLPSHPRPCSLLARKCSKGAHLRASLNVPSALRRIAPLFYQVPRLIWRFFDSRLSHSAALVPIFMAAAEMRRLGASIKISGAGECATAMSLAWFLETCGVPMEPGPAGNHPSCLKTSSPQIKRIIISIPWFRRKSWL
jgi:hypothetical protein